MPLIQACLLLFVLLLPSPNAAGEEVILSIQKKLVRISGSSGTRIAINGSIPGPTLRFRDGDEVLIRVKNEMDEPTSVHWHGILLPGDMDGVPGLNGFGGIAPGQSYLYHFRLRQAGTYWYHAHSMGQEQDGLYGSIVVTPKSGERIKSDRDYVVLLSEFSPEMSGEILSNLKMDSGYYNYAKRTVGDLIDQASTKGLGAALKDASQWGEMRMSPSDLSDVSGYTFLVNGYPPEQAWTGIFKPGETVRLRIINASAMSIFDFRIPGLKLRVVQADGQDIKPIMVDEMRIGVAETYDVLVQPEAEKAYPIIGEPIDRTGFAVGALAPSEGMTVEIPSHRERALLTMADMGMDHHMGHEMHHSTHGSMAGMTSGWSDSGAPDGSKVLSYSDLISYSSQPDTRPPSREIELHLGGSMERYIWTINGKKYSETSPILLHYGERVRITYINETMMAHPMHLHGMFVQLENGQPAASMPSKHTVIIPPGKRYSVLLSVNEPGEWALHCHLLYHMLSGMMTSATVSKVDTNLEEQPGKETGELHAP